ncbi:extracellular solute-binding protein [Treponema parvum]|uniref:Extracellular solute-binding protein n=1 Tax=Treponema parvum TaxID=138851 RepID=A0A975IE32_9SPIR|nr:extracellular solute-binding protein [Treponema parvum]QTQ13437.1 extracellular solute-binding protein [Treponema parvum]
MKRIFNEFFAAALMGAAILSVSCSKKTSETANKTLYLFNWTYYTPDSLIKKFEKEFDVTVKVDTFDSNEVMYAKLKAGAKGYDITFPSQDYASIMIKQGMLKEIDIEKFPNSKYINPKVLEKATYDPTMKYGVPYYMGAAGVAINKQKVAYYEKTWGLFGRTDLKDHMTMMDDMREVLGDALAFQGKSVNTLDDKEIEAAKDLVINSWRPNLIKFDAEGFGKSFASGDFWVCQGYAEVVFGEVPEEKQADMVDFFIPKEGGPMYIDSMVILKGAKNYELAMKFINFIHEPENYAIFLDEFRFPCYVNTEAEKFRKTKPMYDAEEMDPCELKEDLGEGLEKYNSAWQEIRFTAK